jgi:hypothetical protein
MTPYKNLSGDSGVVTYDIGATFIKIQFRSGPQIYIYDYAIPGAHHVEQMKKLAIKGKGLAAYVSHNIKDNYARIE